jgi:hypothetical protein
MIDFKPKRKLNIKNSTWLSRLLAISVVRYTVAGFFSVITTLLLFILMNYLLGNFDKYAKVITDNLFTLQFIKLDKDSGGSGESELPVQRIQRPAEPPEQPVLQEDDKPLTNEQRRQLIIESLLENSDETDNNSMEDNGVTGPEQPSLVPDGNN